ncbi:glucosyltransferase, partial [Genlisea aurea]
PHFVLLPFMAQGHLIPMLDIAKLLASRNCHVTILLTPANQTRLNDVLSRAVHSGGLKIQTLTLQFPPPDSDLPAACQNFDNLTSKSDGLKFFAAISLLQNHVRESLLALDPKPDCLIADMCFSWGSRIAGELGIPRIIFHGFCCLSLHCSSIFGSPSAEVESLAASDLDYFVLPDLPDRIEITRAQLRGTVDDRGKEWDGFISAMKEDAEGSLGAVVNSFEELESEYVKLYRQKLGMDKKVWCVGPVSLCNREKVDMAERGSNLATVDRDEIFRWLDRRSAGSVVYVCLGSLAKLPAEQMVELGLGLELTNRPFIWVVRDPSDQLNHWFAHENFHDRVKGRGLVIEGWAPQVLILSHPSVGCFVTHCGWNSSLEGIASGLPMITWPVLAEQFLNEKLIVSVIKTGLRSGVEIPLGFLQEHEVKEVQVKSDGIRGAIEAVMDGGEEGEERRERARRLGEAARIAVDEGGSSYHNMTSLIEDVA